MPSSYALRQTFMPKKASQKLGTERKMSLHQLLAFMKLTQGLKQNHKVQLTGPWWLSGLERCFSHSFVLELKVEGSNPGVIYFRDLSNLNAFGREQCACAEERI